MPTEIRLHPAAEQELRGSYLWYLERSESVAAAFEGEVGHAVEVVAESPNRWPRLSSTVRRYVFPRFPYYLVYRTQPYGVEIIAFAHQKQRPGYWKGRLPSTT